MKKILIALLLTILLAGGITGYLFRDKVINVINKNTSDNVLIPYNLEDNESMASFLMTQKELLGKKEYKNFLYNINQQVSVALTDLGKLVPGYDDLSNVLFVDNEETKVINFINMNSYGTNYESFYTAFTWVDGVNESNPNWNGYFLYNDELIDTIINSTYPEELEEETNEVIDSENTDKTSDYNEITALTGEEVESEENLNALMQSQFGDNYQKVVKLIELAKNAISGNEAVFNYLGVNEQGFGFGGVQKENTFYLTVGKLNEENKLSTDNYILFTIDTDGNYIDYSETLINVSKDSTVQIDVAEELESVEEESNVSETTEEPTEEIVEETSTEESSEATPEVKKTPEDLFDEILQSKEVE